MTDDDRYSLDALEALSRARWCKQHGTTRFFCDHKHDGYTLDTVSSEQVVGVVPAHHTDPAQGTIYVPLYNDGFYNDGAPES